MRENVLLSKAVGRDPPVCGSADSQALPSNCWTIAGQICLKCSLESGKWGSKAKISTNWMAEKHTWIDSKEKMHLWMSGRNKQVSQCLHAVLHAQIEYLSRFYLCPISAYSSSFTAAAVHLMCGLFPWPSRDAPPLPVVRACCTFLPHTQQMKQLLQVWAEKWQYTNVMSLERLYMKD